MIKVGIYKRQSGCTHPIIYLLRFMINARSVIEKTEDLYLHRCDGILIRVNRNDGPHSSVLSKKQVSECKGAFGIARDCLHHLMSKIVKRFANYLHMGRKMVIFEIVQYLL